MLQTHITCITIAELLILHTFDVLNCKFFVFFFFGSMTAPPFLLIYQFYVKFALNVSPSVRLAATLANCLTVDGNMT